MAPSSSLLARVREEPARRLHDVMERPNRPSRIRDGPHDLVGLRLNLGVSDSLTDGDGSARRGELLAQPADQVRRGDGRGLRAGEQVPVGMSGAAQSTLDDTPASTTKAARWAALEGFERGSPTARRSVPPSATLRGQASAAGG